MAHRIANQHGLSLVPYGGQTYRAWKERQVAQEADRESRPGYTGKRAHWQLTSRQLALFSMHGVTPGLRFEKLGIKEQRIGFYLLGHAGAAGSFAGVYLTDLHALDTLGVDLLLPRAN